MGCFSYGISHGCDSGCPVLWEGGCKIAEEVIEQIASELEAADLIDLKDSYGLLQEGEYRSIW